MPRPAAVKVRIAYLLDPSSADQVRAIRAQLGLTQAQAAQRALVSPRAWIKYESGERAIPRPTWVLFLLRSKLLTLKQLELLLRTT